MESGNELSPTLQLPAAEGCLGVEERRAASGQRASELG
jgi:hypothetical protein